MLLQNYKVPHQYCSWVTSVTYETSCTTCRPTEASLCQHEMMDLPRKMTLMVDPHNICNVIYNARGIPTSPNNAPATQKGSHDWSSSHFRRCLQCAEQQRLPSNIRTGQQRSFCKWRPNFTKCCVCHVKSHFSWKLDWSRSLWKIAFWCGDIDCLMQFFGSWDTAGEPLSQSRFNGSDHVQSASTSAYSCQSWCG